MTTLFNKLKTMPLDVVWQHAKSIAVAIGLIWGSLWWLGGDYVRAQADEALVKMLTKQGMAPEDFKSMKRNIDDMGRDLDKVVADTAATSRTIATVGKDVDRVQQQLDALNKQSDRTYDLLKTLIPMMRTEALTP